MTGQLAILIFEGLMGLFTAFSAYSLFFSTPASIAKAREAMRIGRWYWVFAGVIATIGAVGLFAGLAIPVVGALAALWMVAYFLVAALTHITHHDVRNVGMPLFFLVIFVVLAVLRWSDLAPVLALVP